MFERCSLQLADVPPYSAREDMNWNSLPAHLRDNSLSLSSSKRHLESFLFSVY